MFRLSTGVIHSARRSVMQQCRWESSAAYQEALKAIRDDLKVNFRFKADVIEKNVIRSMLTEIKNKEIDTPTKVHDEFDLYELFAKMIKQRQESAKEYMKVGNPDRFHQVGLNELREVDYIKKYIDALPVATDAEIDARVEKAAKLALEEGAKLEKISDLMAKIPWKSINSDWRASKTAVSASVQRVFKDL